MSETKLSSLTFTSGESIPPPTSLKPKSYQPTIYSSLPDE
jgi:hypothetical protein